MDLEQFYSDIGRFKKDESSKEMAESNSSSSPQLPRPVWKALDKNDDAKRLQMREALEQLQQVGSEASLFDPREDERNEAWMASRFKREGSQSDAVLSCPHCFTQVSYYNQQHSKYKLQYRATRPANCRVDYQQAIVKKGRTGTQEVYYSVSCGVCGVEVGVLDEHGIYHFYNVIPEKM